MFKHLFSFFTPLKGPNIVVQSTFGPMIVNSNDKYIGAEIRKTGAWQIAEVQFILQLAEFLIQEHGRILVYDIGANVGQHTLALATTFKDSIKIRAFEPQRPIFQMLCDTLALNKCQNVNCEFALVGAESGKVITVRLPDYSALNNFGGFEFVKAAISDNDDMQLDETEEVIPCRTVDSYAEHVHLMKIDVEGMELEVLAGARETIAQMQPICYVETCKVGEEPIQAFFTGIGYKVFARNDNIVAIPNVNFSNLRFLQFVNSMSENSRLLLR